MVTHPDQLWFPEVGLRKRDVVDYYRAVSPVLLPHVRGRPFTIKRHYNGPRSPFAWIKDAPPELPAWIPTSSQPAKSRGGEPVRYPLVEDERALVWMVDFGCVDLHVWPSRADRPGRPDFVLFDLDPAGVGFREVAAAALLLREALLALGLEAWPMTSGGDGMHVRVPIARRHDHAEARRFVEVVARALARTSGGLVTLERAAGRRVGVFVDAKMNGHGQQLVAPYSVRPRPGAPVATPLRWEEVGDELDPASFTPPAVLERVAREGDPGAPLLRGRQRLGAALARIS